MPSSIYGEKKSLCAIVFKFWVKWVDSTMINEDFDSYHVYHVLLDLWSTYKINIYYNLDHC